MSKDEKYIMFNKNMNIKDIIYHDNKEATFKRNFPPLLDKPCWIKGIKYKIKYETPTVYYFGKIDDIECGIDKSLEGVEYTVGEIVKGN